MRSDPLESWRTAATVRRLLSDLIAAELVRLRPGAARAADPAALDRSALGSLELLELATAVAVRFQLYETGGDRALLARPALDDWVAIVLEHRACWHRALGFQSSGSTGPPRVQLHPLSLLAEEIVWFAERLGRRRRVLTAIPAHHLYGFLFGILLPARLGVAARDVRDALPGGVLARARPGDLIVAHPAWLELALHGPLKTASDVTVVTSTAPCPERVWQALRAGGIARIVEVYGASETSGIGTREAPDAPFELLPYWSRVPDTAHALVRAGPAGADARHALPDRTRWQGARRFTLGGRRDGAVQVGGVNVFPERVRRCLCGHPEVAAAAVRPDRAALGGRLKAFVVPAPDCMDPDGLPERLRAWLADRLTPAERPGALTVGRELPRSPLGKLADWEPLHP